MDNGIPLPGIPRELVNERVKLQKLNANLKRELAAECLKVERLRSAMREIIQSRSSVGSYAEYVWRITRIAASVLEKTE